MAEAILRDLASKKGKDVASYSSGIFAENGDVATLNSIEVLKKYKIDLRYHHATNIQNANIEKMDIILCMTKEHKQRLIQLYPNSKDKTYLLKEYVNGEEKDINDPWGCELDTYQKCGKQIYEAIEKLVDML